MSPYLVTSEESLTEINIKLKAHDEPPVKQINFRPNIVLKGATVPYLEDIINKMQIGNAIFRRIKGCTRCKETTFDPDKNAYRKSLEPLETLYEEKMDEKLGGCIFGQNYCCDLLSENATINVGDEVHILEYKK